MKRRWFMLLFVGLLVLTVFTKLHGHFWRDMKVELSTEYPLSGFSEIITLSNEHLLVQTFSPHDAALVEVILPIVAVDEINDSDSWLEFVLEHEQLKDPVVARITPDAMRAGEVVVTVEADEDIDWRDGVARMQLSVIGSGMVTLGVQDNPFLSTHRFPGELLIDDSRVERELVFRPVFADEQPATAYLNVVEEYWLAMQLDPAHWLVVSAIFVMVAVMGWMGLQQFLSDQALDWHLLMFLIGWIVVYVSLRMANV